MKEREWASVLVITQNIWLPSGHAVSVLPPPRLLILWNRHHADLLGAVAVLVNA